MRRPKKIKKNNGQIQNPPHHGHGTYKKLYNIIIYYTRKMVHFVFSQYLPGNIGGHNKHVVNVPGQFHLEDNLWKLLSFCFRLLQICMCGSGIHVIWWHLYESHFKYNNKTIERTIRHNQCCALNTKFMMAKVTYI